MPIPGLPANAVGSRVVEYGSPWQRSPPPHASSLLESATDGTLIRTEDEEVAPSESGRRRKKFKRLVRGFRRVFDPTSSKRLTQSSIHDPIHKPALRRQVKPEEWRAYGYWARPYIRGVGVVRNSSPRPVAHESELDPDDIFGDLWGRHGSPHPERWVPLSRHPFLPPRPDAFVLPDPASPTPTPRELQLNPYLEHQLLGMPSIVFDISMEPTAITFSATENLIPLMPGDLAQPATFPLVTRIVISAVADDTAHPWPWPITIYNSSGVKVEDVFDCIYENFRQFLTRDEYDRLSEKKRYLVQRVLQARCKPLSDSPYAPEYTDEGVRRHDYMLDRTLFRGLEPHPHEDDTWIMFVGSH
ncbi:hypothetical protein NEOLEDRAFT_1134448 [Neolentinus lepideus HHB14362 ss-1]|uniref:DUF6699 domain-containing protein n=1 Tax=Neolentinus lepideus HHB14362 ss-1 TaxID=1314782 RepID=A0A165S8F7_9AGAM|nr:hypothetical protein NEOLEDRAFT_1134448 [Neolentinus lepideus HHB14362 ss-1]